MSKSLVNGCVGKRYYSSFVSAEGGVLSAARSRPKVYLRAYKCEHCPYIHLSKKGAVRREIELRVAADKAEQQRIRKQFKG